MEPKYRVGDRVDERIGTSKKDGVIREVIWRTIYTIYRVSWNGETLNYFEHELEPAVEPEPIEQEAKHE